MFRALAGLAFVVATSAGADADKWTVTREGVEVRRQGEVVRIALPGWQWAGPPYGRMLALGTGSRGEVLVTSDVVPTVWRIEPRSLEVTVHPLALDADRDKDIGFITVVYAPSAGVYFARSALDGACWRVDAALTAARKFRHGEKRPLAAAGICMPE